MTLRRVWLGNECENGSEKDRIFWCGSLYFNWGFKCSVPGSTYSLDWVIIINLWYHKDLNFPYAEETSEREVCWDVRNISFRSLETEQFLAILSQREQSELQPLFCIETPLCAPSMLSIYTFLHALCSLRLNISPYLAFMQIICIVFLLYALPQCKLRCSSR